MEDQQQIQQPPRQLYFFSLRWGTYSSLAAICFMSKVIPSTKIFTILLVTGYFLYMLADTLKIFSAHEQNHKDIRKSLRWSLITNSQDFLYFVLAVIIGVVL